MTVSKKTDFLLELSGKQMEICLQITDIRFAFKAFIRTLKIQKMILTNGTEKVYQTASNDISYWHRNERNVKVDIFVSVHIKHSIEKKEKKKKNGKYTSVGQSISIA